MPKLRTARDLLNLRAGRNDWYRIKNLAPEAGGGAEVMIYDEIGYFGVTAQDFLRDLAEIDGPLTLRLNTPGGEVFDGLAIYNALSQRGNVTVHVDGLAASIGSVIAMAASPGQLSIAKRATMMIHDGFSMAVGNAQDMRDLADLLDEQSDNIAGVYADRTGKPADYWRDQMRKESWYTGQAAVDAGLADKVSGAEAVANSWDLSIFMHAPGVKNALSSDMHGDHKRLDPDGDGDCDACPEGDTDHDYWSPDGKQVQDLPGQPMDRVRRFFNADKYTQADRDRMAKSGEAMPDGSYPIADAEDLDNAIHAVGRGNASHDDIRKHVITRAKALGLSSEIPDNWNDDGSLKSASNQLADSQLFNGEVSGLASLLVSGLKGGQA